MSCRPAVKTTDDLTVIGISFDGDGKDQDETTEIATSTQASKEEPTANKKNDPVLGQPLRGYTAEHLLDIIVGNQVSKENICQRVPRAVCKHTADVVDTVALGCIRTSGNYKSEGLPPESCRCTGS